MVVKLLDGITPLYLIGDSHCLQYTEVMFENDQPLLKFGCKTKFFFDLPAERYFQDGSPNSMVVDSLKSEGILNREGNPGWLVPDASSTYLSGRPAHAPIMVLFGGEVDIQYLLSKLGNEFDFELPDDPGYGVDFDKQPMSFESVRNRIAAAFDPLIAALQWLRPSFPRMMVHALPPRSRNEEWAARWSFRVSVDAPIRAKIALAANRYLRDACGRLDIPFIDPWDFLSLDGYLRAEFDLDGLHVNRTALTKSLELIVGAILDRTGPTANNIRYEALKFHSPAYQGPVHPEANDWADQGFVFDNLGGPAAAGLEADCSFEPVSGNEWASPDWVGYPRTGRPGGSVARPSEAMIEKAARLLCVGHGRTVLQAGDAKEFTVINFRPFEIDDGASVLVSSLPTPRGCRRALMFLGGAGSIQLIDNSGATAVERSVRAGSIVVYDPGRVNCRARAEGDAARFAEIMLIPRYPFQPFRVVAAGLNDWPADPFQYSVGGLTAYPPFETDLIRDRA
jgi:hypothetical protein